MRNLLATRTLNDDVCVVCKVNYEVACIHTYMGCVCVMRQTHHVLKCGWYPQVKHAHANRVTRKSCQPEGKHTALSDTLASLTWPTLTCIVYEAIIFT